MSFCYQREKESEIKWGEKETERKQQDWFNWRSPTSEWILWVAKYCSELRALLLSTTVSCLIDDRYYLNIWQLLPMIVGMISQWVSLLYCHTNKEQPPPNNNTGHPPEYCHFQQSWWRHYPPYLIADTMSVVNLRQAHQSRSVGPKWDKSGNFFPDQIQYILAQRVIKSPDLSLHRPIWHTFETNLTSVLC